jgi:hypothetical protein
MVTVMDWEFWPRMVEGKVRLVAERVSVGAARPVPVRETVWVPRLSKMVKTPEKEPGAVGANPRATVHPVPASKTVLQVLAPRTKGAEAATEVRVTEAGVVFCMFRDWVAVVPTC